MKQYRWSALDATAREALLRRPALQQGEELRAQVVRILEQVRTEGDIALQTLTAKLDGVSLSAFAASAADFERAEAALSERDKAAIAAAASNIEAFHRAQLRAPIAVDTAPGVLCERVTRPIQRVGLYVPAGSAALPSTALMLGIPARLAGCPVRVLCSPPQRNGDIAASVLYAARVCGIEQVFKIGGAQAIAAMAYGTASIPKVDKIFGPGNAWVTQAKAIVAADPLAAAQDLPAGPSEVMVIADERAEPIFVAADLLSQAEHGGDSQVLLVTTSAKFADAVLRQLEPQKAVLSRRALVDKALAHSLIVLVDDLQTAMEVANAYAPEHLILQIEQPRAWLEKIYAAGSIFLGPWAPESVGDYCSGTNHILPTYGFARAYSSLGLADFQRAMTIQELTPAGLGAIGPIAETLATLEGLDAHALAVRRRLDALASSGAIDVSP